MYTIYSKVLLKSGLYICFFSTRNDFAPASTMVASTDPNIASAGQVKYARDMVGKKFEGNMDASVDWLAHLMELPLADVPHPSTWDTTLTKDMAGIILTAAGLGFLGFGATPPSSEWGAMIASGHPYIFDHWWLATVPGLAILMVSVGFNLFGDALRDVLDPRS